MTKTLGWTCKCGAFGTNQDSRKFHNCDRYLARPTPRPKRGHYFIEKVDGRLARPQHTRVKDVDGVVHAYQVHDPIAWRSRLLFEEEVDCVMRTPPLEEWARPLNPRIVRIPNGSEYGRAGLTLPTGEAGERHVDRDRRRDLGSVAAIRTDFLASQGWRVVKAGGSEVPRGRPKSRLAGDFLAAALRRDLPYNLDDLRECVSMRKRTGASVVVYDHLATWVYARNPRRTALADHLRCDRKTIDRLHVKGQKLTKQLTRIENKLDGLNSRLDLLLAHLRESDLLPADIPTAIDEFINLVLADAA